MGREEGMVVEARQNITHFVELRFPIVLTWVTTRIEQITDLATLHRILSALYLAITEEEVRTIFADSGESGKQMKIDG